MRGAGHSLVDAFFDGLTVVEIADRRNQYAGKLLSDGGAWVIQVEPLTGSLGRASTTTQSPTKSQGRRVERLASPSVEKIELISTASC